MDYIWWQQPVVPLLDVCNQPLLAQTTAINLGAITVRLRPGPCILGKAGSNTGGSSFVVKCEGKVSGELKLSTARINGDIQYKRHYKYHSDSRMRRNFCSFVNVC